MKKNFYVKTEEYINFLCSVKPHRRTGSKGNQDATNYFKQQISQWNYDIDTTKFPCLDHKNNGSKLNYKKTQFETFTSPFSQPVDITSIIEIVSTIKNLENIQCENKILLMKGEICKEQLMPKNFIFYNPDHHKKIYTLLEEKKPAAIITATTKNEEMVGNFYPFPLFEDGDFDIPSVYCKDIVGNNIEQIKQKENPNFTLKIDTKRIPSTASNVLAKKNSEIKKKIVICAHIDARDTTPGASDNASGTAVLLVLAELLKDYKGSYQIEIIAFNGEDYYSVGGQMDYLKRYSSELDDISLAINIDDVGFKEGKTSYSLYNCSKEISEKIQSAFKPYKEMMDGVQWYQGDHMIFVQNQIPAMAITSEKSMELLRTITHTKKDNPGILDYNKIVDISYALRNLIIKYFQ